MGIVSNIICKTVGIAGMSAVAYDAYSVAKKNSARVSQMETADHFEKVVMSTRTMDNESYVGNAMQKKVADLRMNNPLFSAYGSVKGFVNGFLSTLGSNIIPVVCAGLAIGTKGFLSRLGAIGVAGCGALIVLREGFGLGKTTPVDK